MHQGRDLFRPKAFRETYLQIGPTELYSSITDSGNCRAGWLPGKWATLQLKIEREESEEPLKMGTEGSHAKLIAGSLHDDRLLVYENMSIDSFTSPYTVKFTTHSSAEGR